MNCEATFIHSKSRSLTTIMHHFRKIYEEVFHEKRHLKTAADAKNQELSLLIN